MYLRKIKRYNFASISNYYCNFQFPIIAIYLIILFRICSWHSCSNLIWLRSINSNMLYNIRKSLRTFLIGYHFSSFHLCCCLFIVRYVLLLLLLLSSFSKCTVSDSSMMKVIVKLLQLRSIYACVLDKYFLAHIGRWFPISKKHRCCIHNTSQRCNCWEPEGR